MSAKRRSTGNETASDLCGVTLMNNQNGHAVAEIMARKDDVSVDHLPSMIRVDGRGTLVFDFDEITEELGTEFDQSDFEEIMSTHYGRMVHLDDKTILFAKPEDAAEYIDFDLQPVR
ncbi:MmoB/DmpM family protein [Saccharopolyspora sp. HNM0983]|uniref:MmoB/DmpM family protein n=1 Tax=Saccharopolyspora montiporae TaxID=2781240 RepID=A0A929G097_9PSEU|nr:MmoB/DmpM family protein [Saccharopolyspora sp. HNM0983]MBE9375380.1 MmoB/DmpM family protein [Saccharopolyspora sp. HNM0983]